jgi:hypothetical protein
LKIITKMNEHCSILTRLYIEVSGSKLDWGELELQLK